jgi:hypothetical protein
MSKGPSGQTTTTTTQSNPAAQAQLPYLENLWSGASNLAGQQSPNISNLQNYAQNQFSASAPWATDIMPRVMDQYTQQIGRGPPSQYQANQLDINAGNAINQGLAFSGGLAEMGKSAYNQSPYWQNAFMGGGQAANQTLQGYGSAATNALSGVGNYAMNTLPGMGQAATGALTGLAPGALSGMQNLSGQALSAGNPAQAGLNYNAAMALGNPALSSGLTGLASGRYIDPSTNPAYASMIQNATTPLVNQYMTATAPQGFGTSGAELAGRYGSGAQTNAQGQAQYGLGQALSNAVSGITNNAYNTGIQGTIGAGQALGGIYGQGVQNATNALGTSGGLAQTGVQNAANIYNQGYGTAGNLLNQGYTTGGNLINQGIGAGTSALSNAYQIGGGLAGQGANALNAFMGNAAGQGLGYLNAGLSGLGAGAGAAQAGYGTANQALTGGGGLLNAGSDALSRALSQAQTFAAYPEQQATAAYNAPWLPYNNLSSILGGSIGGQGSGTTSQPYFNNTGANVLGGITGALGIASKVAPLIAMI